MDRVNEQLYQANIDLVDKNKLLEEDKRILRKRINKALEYIENTYEDYKNEDGSLPLTLHDQELLEILQGRYVDNE